MDSYGLGQGTVATSCERYNEFGEFIEQLSNSQLLKRDSCPLSELFGLLVGFHTDLESMQNFETAY